MISNMGVISSTITGLLVFTLVVRSQETVGTAGVDYPDYQSIPKTSFRCSEQKHIPGFYADLETECQVFHLCLENRQESFLCPSGTTFNQATLTCDYWYSSNCSLAPLLYSVNSGPVMEKARRNIPTLIKLKNRSQNRPSVRTNGANVYEKITSLYENIADETQSDFAKTSDVPEDIKESGPEISRELGTDEMPEETREGSTKKDFLLNDAILSRWESSNQNDEEPQDAYYTGTLGQEAEDNMREHILYDPVTEQYFVDYDSFQNEWQRDPEDEVDQFRSIYDRYPNKYGLSLNDYVDESEIPTESVINDPQDFTEILDTVGMGESEQFRRMLDTEQPAKSVRRKPIYTVIREDDGDEVRVPGISRGVKYPILDFDDSLPATESISTDTEDSFEEISTEILEMEEKTDSDVSFEITDEMRNPNFTPLNTSEVPLTSEEFEHAIITELVLPKIDELDLRMISEEEQRDEESPESVSKDFQDSDQFSSVEDANPDDYESYSAEYNGDDIVIVETPKTDRESRGNEEKTNWYQSGATTFVEDAAAVDDTYVVIPDESDASVLDQYSETELADSSDGSTNGEESDEQNEINVDYDSYSALRNYFLSNYVSPGAYASVDPYGFQMPGYYFPNEYGRLQPFTSEGFLNPEHQELLRLPYEYADDSGATNGQEFQIAFSDGDSPDGYFPLAESGSYSYEQPTRFADYMYDAENGYPYGNVYDSPDLDAAVRNYGYDTSDFSESVRYSDLNENPEAAFEINRDYSEPGIPSWFQSDSAESSEMELTGVADSSTPTEDALVDLYGATESGNEDLNELSVPVESIEDAESMKKPETYYLFDFDEDGEEKVEVRLEGDEETSQPDAEQLDLKELYQTEKPWQLNESSEGNLRSINVGSESESTKTEPDILSTREELVSKVYAESPELSEPALNIKSREIPDSLSFETTDGSRVNEKPVTSSSALEHLAGLNNARASKGSDASNVYLPSDSKFLNRMVFPEPMGFGSYDGNMGQQYGIADAVMTSGTENAYSHRTGNSKQPRISKLSDIQERIRSLKQGKFGAFKKYMNSARDGD